MRSFSPAGAWAHAYPLYFPAPLPPPPPPVYAVFLERTLRNPREAKVIIANRKLNGDTTTKTELGDAVMAHMGFPIPYRNNFINDPIVFGMDPRQSGSLADDEESPSRHLLDHPPKLQDEVLDAACRGDASKANPYFVLLTRDTRTQALAPTAQLGSVFFSSTDLKEVAGKFFQPYRDFHRYGLHLNANEPLPTIELPQPMIDDINRSFDLSIEIQQLTTQLKKRARSETVVDQALEIWESNTVPQRPFVIGAENFPSEVNLAQPAAAWLLCNNDNLAKLTDHVQSYAFIDCHHADTRLFKFGKPDMLMVPRVAIEGRAHPPDFFERDPHGQARTESGLATHSQLVSDDNVALILEVKPKPKFNSEGAREQTMKYMKAYLAENPMRRRIWGLLTDLCSGTLFLMERDDRSSNMRDGYQVTRFASLTGSRFVSLLKELLRQPPDAFYDATPTVLQSEDSDASAQHEIVCKGRLGHGTFGRVLRIAYKDSADQFALKIPNKSLQFPERESNINTEWRLTQRVIGCKHGPTQAQIVYGRRLSGQVQRPAFLQCQPVGLQDLTLWTRDLLLELLEGLLEIHARDVIHRDIRPSNVVVDIAASGARKLILIDWGCAMEKGVLHVYAGARAYAAYRLYEGWMEEQVALPSDDISSLLLTAFSVYHAQGNIECCNQPQRIDQEGANWLSFWEQKLPRSWWDLYKNMPASENDAHRAAKALLEDLGAEPVWFV